MQKIEDEFLKRFQITFRGEADEHIRNFYSGLDELEKNPDAGRVEQIIETMFREIHSLKGAARSIGNKETESLCQPLESVFSGLKRKELILSPSFYKIFYQSADWLKILVLPESADLPAIDRKKLRETIQLLNDLTAKRQSDTSVQVASQEDSTNTASDNSPAEVFEVREVTSPNAYETVRINLNRLDPLFLEAEELIQTKVALKQRIGEMTEISDELDNWIQTQKKMRANRANLNHSGLLTWMEETEVKLYKLDNLLSKLTSHTKHDHFTLSRMVDDHLESMKQILMLPVSSLVETFPSMIKDIARNQEKEINFIIKGSELELDKRILDELKDPLVHLIRNSIDHGIDKPAERLNQKKPTRI